MDDNKNIDQLKNQGWEDMSTLLDTHMPEEKIRPVIWWYWLAGAAALLMAVAIPLTLLMNENSPDGSILKNQDQVISQDDGKAPGMEDKMEFNYDPASSDKAILAGGQKGQDNLADLGRTSFSSDVIAMNRKNENKKDFNHVASDGYGQNVADTQKSTSDLVTDEIVVKDLGQSLPNLEIANLEQQFFQVGKTGLSLEPFLWNRPKTIKVPQSKGKITASVFAETMWSPSDHFGFVNAGPGVQYAVGKWTLGLLGGLALPLPGQKAFYSANLPFSSQYNFDYASDSKFEMNSPGFAVSNSSSVYYERYSMKPGYMVSFSVQRQFAGRWGIGADLGHIRFRYDFTQKAVPNQNNAASTQLANAKNSLWYSGLSVNYALGEHWNVSGGVRFINLLTAGDVGVIPAVRMEYQF